MCDTNWLTAEVPWLEKQTAVGNNCSMPPTSTWKEDAQNNTGSCWENLLFVQRKVLMARADSCVIDIELTTSSSSGSSLQQPHVVTFAHNGQKFVSSSNIVNPQAQSSVGGQAPEGNDLPPCNTLKEMECFTLLAVEEATTRRGRALKKGLETWRHDVRVLQKRIDRKEQQSSQIMNEVYQLVGLFIVFQGVLYMAAAQAQLLDCRNWSTVFVLSVLASAAAIAGVTQKLLQLEDIQKTIKKEEEYPRVSITLPIFLFLPCSTRMPCENQCGC